MKHGNVRHQFLENVRKHVHVALNFLCQVLVLELLNVFFEDPLRAGTAKFVSKSKHIVVLAELFVRLTPDGLMISNLKHKADR